MRLLITGGAGFMGSNFIHHVLSKYPDYQIINLDKLTYAGNLANLEDIENNPNYRFVKGDICDPKLVDDLMKEVDVVVNYAAESHVDRSITDPESFARTNILGTLNLLTAAKNNGNKRFVQISTDEVYGVTPEGKSFDERAVFEPNSPYAASKAGADLMARAFHVTYSLGVVVTHSVNFYGPYQFPEKFVSLSITNVLEGKKIPIYGSGEQSREWIFTDDHCSAIDIVLHKGKEGQVYNIGTGCEKTNLEMAEEILKILGKDNSLIEFVKDRPGHDHRYSLDHSKLTKELGWEPSLSFEEGLEKTIQWYRENQQWWKPLKEKNKDYFERQYK